MNINDSKGTSIQTFVHCCNVDVTVSIIEQVSSVHLLSSFPESNPAREFVSAS